MKTTPNYVPIQSGIAGTSAVSLHLLEWLGKNQFINRRHLLA